MPIFLEWRGVPFTAWLFRIAANAVADRWQRKMKEQADPVPESPADRGWKDIERRAMLFQLVDSLPPDQRRVIIKRFVERRSICEIAQEFHRTEGAIKQLQFRAPDCLIRWVIAESKIAFSGPCREGGF